jgi:hypothetical protein
VLLMKMPPVLGLNVESNLEPKIEFSEGLIGINKVAGFLMENPSALGASLGKRLMSRLAEVQESGMPIDSGTLSRMAKCARDQWSASMAHQEKRLLLSQGELWWQNHRNLSDQRWSG